MSGIYDIIKRPVVTEKTTNPLFPNRVSFEVSMDSNKHQIAQAVETLFSVHVVKVNTAVMPGKPKRFGRTLGRRSAWKKAVVTLRDGETIEFSSPETPATEEE